MKKILVVFIIIFSLFFVPITYSKYTETVSKSFTLNVRQPKYYIAFRDNETNDELPEGYQAVDYIESSGQEYINTEIKAKGSIGFEVSFTTNDKFSTVYPGYGSIFGGRTASARNEIQITTYNANTKAGTFRYGKSSLEANIELTEQNIIRYLDNEYYANGITYEVSRTEFESNQNITVFAVNNGGNITQHGKLKLYYLRLYDGEELVRNYIPCIRISDNELGLYDMVSDTFFENEGTGEFKTSENALQEFNYGTAKNLVPNSFTRTGMHFVNWNTNQDGTGTSYADEENILNLSSKEGEVINLYAQWKTNEYYKIAYHVNLNVLPTGYIPVEYIESTGKEYLRTGVNPKGSIGFEVKFETFNTFSGNESEYGSIFGGRNDSQINEIQLTTYATTGLKNGTLRYAQSSHPGNIELGEINKISFIGNTYVTNTEQYQIAREEFESSNEITIFAVNDGGNIKQFGKVRLYNLKIYDDETIIRDYVPCYREIDGEIGLYDLVNNTFIQNQGEGLLLKDKIQEAVYEVDTKLQKNEFERDDYKFISWNTKADGTGISYNEEDIIKYTDYIENNQIDLYAQWEPITN